MKRFLLYLMALTLACSPACAEIANGTTGVHNTVPIVAQSTGILESLAAEAGQRVSADETIGRIRETRVFAEQDGKIASLNIRAGQKISGTALQITPDCRYTVYCTADDAYETAETMFPHSGETVYIRCTANGTHRGIGTITLMEEDDYLVEPFGGEFQIGETVKLYRSADFSKKQCVGKGTVVAAEAIGYECEGTIGEVYVVKGAQVEKGQLLYTYVSGETGMISSPADGIVRELNAAAGDAVTDGQIIGAVAAYGDIRIAVKIGESAAGALRTGAKVECSAAAGKEETTAAGTVESVAGPDEDGLFTAWIVCPELCDRLGRRVEVRF